MRDSAATIGDLPGLDRAFPLECQSVISTFSPTRDTRVDLEQRSIDSQLSGSATGIYDRRSRAAYPVQNVLAIVHLLFGRPLGLTIVNSWEGEDFHSYLEIFLNPWLTQCPSK